ncbi:MAG TPA: fused MFS/spermidine synthase, partial [Labilithrix sp.]|nr:fused MFS/spermidine synthase [Labilithrix sp.]
MIVPLLGGAPQVWIVCSLCFQTLLLAGYGYAHFVGTRVRARRQIALQIALLAAVLFVMPVAVDDARAQELSARHPTLGLLILLLRTIGLPFFVLSTSSPLLQRWFAEHGERDPYYLYAASNAGSMLALLGYPLFVEPRLTVRAQSHALHIGFAVYAALVVACAVGTLRRPPAPGVEATPAPPQVRGSHSDPLLLTRGSSERETRMVRWRQRFVWVALSFAPSSLLLGATEYVTTDIASVPLLWVLPLALYLLSFIFAFAKKSSLRPAKWSRALVLAMALVASLTAARVTGPPWVVIAAHMLLLFLASVVCHRALAERRPPVSRLTEFYLLLSIGGVLGGIFNGLLAPTIFDDLYEYPIAIGLVGLGRSGLAADGQEKPVRIHRWATLADIALGVAVGFVAYGLERSLASSGGTSVASLVLRIGVVLVVALVWSKRPVRYAVAVASFLLAAMGARGEFGTTLWADRGFFGVLRVTRDDTSRFHFLLSGRAMHGKQALDPAQAKTPVAYYHPTGPAGDVLGPVPSPNHKLAPRSVGVIGLGVGSLAAYARPGDEWTFFEINPEVVEVARRHFTYLKTAEEFALIHVEVGDARLRLREGEDARFDVLVLDAFSSDAIPTHLVTREALAVYRRALRPGGLLLAHVTNDHVRLAPVFGALARDARMTAIVRRDDANVGPMVKDGSVPEDTTLGKVASEWVVLTDRR